MRYHKIMRTKKTRVAKIRRNKVMQKEMQLRTIHLQQMQKRRTKNCMMNQMQRYFDRTRTMTK